MKSPARGEAGPARDGPHRDLEALLAPERVLSRAIDRIAYSADASFYRLIPEVVVRPISMEEIRALFAWSRTQRLPLTFRAAGTSLSGQAITSGVLVDLGRHWNRLQVEDGGALVRVQPGVIGSRVNASLAPLGRRMGPDPASIDACMIGGILANNSSGMCCGVAENAYHTLESMTCVLPNGVIVDTAARDADRRLAEEAPDVSKGLREIKRRLEASPLLADRIRARYRMKNTTGYTLNALIDFTSPTEMLEHLLVGSEGTLAFIAEAVLRTFPDAPQKSTGLLFFESVPTACRAIGPLQESGAKAIELLDRASLRSVESQPWAPELLRELPPDSAALLVEYQCRDRDELVEAGRAARQACRTLPLLVAPGFTEDPVERAGLWHVRKGLYPSIGAMRRQGTAVIIEDVVFPAPALSQGVLDLQSIFRDHGYDEAILFGHAKDGNLHFVITQSFGQGEEIARYGRFLEDVVRMVLAQGGALKAEHGTGRNMAPFVEAEWGTEAYEIMKDLKSLFDPENLLNPGVIINPDPQAHLRDLKDLPVVEAEVDRCIECGFCEPRCPSRRLTLTPRQRIVVRREMARRSLAGGDPELFREIEADYGYDGLETCAVDGLCAMECPVGINTGELVKTLRAAALSPRALRRAAWMVRHFGSVERGVRILLRLGALSDGVLGLRGTQAVSRGAGRLLGRRIPVWSESIPRAAPARLPVSNRGGAEAVYFPSCLTRVMGRPPKSAADGADVPLVDTLVTLAARAHVGIWVPPACAGHCCGMPFASKGYSAAGREMLERTVERLWDWSDQGRLPVVMDASSCAYALRTGGDDLQLQTRERLGRLQILDAIDFVHDVLLPRLRTRQLAVSVTLHPNCSARKLGLEGKLLAIARRCAASASIPQDLECCGTAGDRGLLFPELTASALAPEVEEVLAGPFDGYYSCNVTCEMGLRQATGKPYRSFLSLVEEASRPQDFD